MPEDNELKHYGVPGMKWGRRKALPISATRAKYDAARKAKKQANKQYNKDFNKAYGHSSMYGVFSRVGKLKKENDRRWEKATKSGQASVKADKAYKQAKQERKQKMKDAYKDINKQTKISEKMLFSRNTRKLAAKYVVDNDMSISDAKKKANNKAIKNTAVILAAYGAYSLAKSDVGKKAISSIKDKATPTRTLLDASGNVIKRFYD